MSNCPKCENKIPLRSFLFVSNYKDIKCPFCNAILSSDKKTLSVIGGISRFCAAITIGMAPVIYYLTDKAYFIEIFVATLLLEISIFIASGIVTRNILKLTSK